MEIPKYEYYLHTWGGFYNDQHQKIHKCEGGDFWFDSKVKRQEYIDKLKKIEEELNAKHLALHINEGFNTRTLPELHRVVRVKKTNELIYSNYKWSFYGDDYRTLEYHIEYKWTPGFNDESAIGDEEDLDKIEIVQEWITGAFKADY